MLATDPALDTLFDPLCPWRQWLRERARAQGVRVRALSERAGLASPSWLSQVTGGHRWPTLADCLAVAPALGMQEQHARSLFLLAEAERLTGLTDESPPADRVERRLSALRAALTQDRRFRVREGDRAASKSYSGVLDTLADEILRIRDGQHTRVITIGHTQATHPDGLSATHGVLDRIRGAFPASSGGPVTSFRVFTELYTLTRPSVTAPYLRRRSRSPVPVVLDHDDPLVFIDLLIESGAVSRSTLARQARCARSTLNRDLNVRSAAVSERLAGALVDMDLVGGEDEYRYLTLLFERRRADPTRWDLIDEELRRIRHPSFLHRTSELDEAYLGDPVAVVLRDMMGFLSLTPGVAWLPDALVVPATTAGIRAACQGLVHMGLARRSATGALDATSVPVELQHPNIGTVNRAFSVYHLAFLRLSQAVVTQLGDGQIADADARFEYMDIDVPGPDPTTAVRAALRRIRKDATEAIDPGGARPDRVAQVLVRATPTVTLDPPG